jgi:hypothetical protein
MKGVSERFLVAYSAGLTVVLAVVVLCGFTLATSVRKGQRFDEITVHRINIVEPDGTVRMVLSNKASAPGAFIKNKEYAHETRQSGGLLFYDDEGTEDGGLIYGVDRGPDGKVSGSNVHLSFDKYMQDQMFTVDAGTDAGHDYSELTMQDRGDYPITDAMEAQHRISALPEGARAAAWETFRATHPGDAKRVVLGRADDGSSQLVLKDAQGRDRIVMRVTREGGATVRVLAADGKVVDEMPREVRVVPSARP